MFSLIVAMTEERVIGRDNQLPWHLSEDLKRFKRLTMGHPIIMGRRTFDSIGRPLPGRENIVVTRNQNYSAVGVTVVHSLEEALQKTQSSPETFVIGGAELFERSLPKADRLYLTVIHKNFPGDVYFPYVDMEKLNIVERTDHQSPPPDSFLYSFITADIRQ